VVPVENQPVARAMAKAAVARAAESPNHTLGYQCCMPYMSMAHC
jgi:hypothetical protein